MSTREQAQKLAERILKLSRFPECSISVEENESAFVRFANNGVTTAGYTEERTVRIASTREGKTGVSQTTELDDAALIAAMKRSEELAEFAPENPERVSPVGPQKYAEYENYDERTATARSAVMVPQVKAVIDSAVSKKLVTAGFLNRSVRVEVIANKAGNFGYQRSTDSRLSTTVRTPDGSSSGWASQPAVKIAEINGADVAARAVEKCVRWARNPIKLEPGKFTVVLEPTAVSDLMRNLMFSLRARAAEEGRSFLSKRGGGTLLGEKLFPDFITLRTDPFDRRFPTSLWGSENLANRAVTWVEKGVVKNLAYDRYWAQKTGKEPTPDALNDAVLEGGDATLADLIRATERGLLVTRFWYIRPVNPQTVQLTGLTRDGLFLIENGEVTQPVMNFRFNESPVRMLQNAKKLARAERTRGGEGTGMVAPAMQVAEFNFTSVSDAV